MDYVQDYDLAYFTTAFPTQLLTKLNVIAGFQSHVEYIYVTASFY